MTATLITAAALALAAGFVTYALASECADRVRDGRRRRVVRTAERCAAGRCAAGRCAHARKRCAR